MKAIILAAGRGTRMRTLTEQKPKCLLPVNDKPILAYQLEALLENGVKDIVIVIGYKGDMIKDYISKNPQFKDLNITYVENNEYGKSDSSYSWWLARNHIQNEDTILHFNSDLVFYPELIKKIIDTPSENAIFIDKEIELEEKSMEQVILEFDTNKILLMDNKTLPGAHGKAVGVAKYSGECIQFMMKQIDGFVTKGNKNQHFYWLLRNAVKEFDIHGLDIGSSYFKEINTLEEYGAVK